MDVRTALAAVLGVGLGVLLVAYPEYVIRAQTAGRLPHDRGGDYGDDPAASGQWRRVVQGLGVVAIAFGFYLGASGLL